MTPEQFCYWLQGRAELMPDTPPSAGEWKMICEHLGAVFHKVTPQLGGIHKDDRSHVIGEKAIPSPSVSDLQRAIGVLPDRFVVRC